MSREGTQKKLGRTGKTRVQMFLDPNLGDAIAHNEIPFTLAVVGDYSGNAKTPSEKGKLKGRDLTLVDRNVPSKDLDAFVKTISPRLSYQVRNTLDPERPKLNVNITFSAMADFSPERVAEAVPELAAMLKLRRTLRDMRGRLVSNEDAEDEFRALLNDSTRLAALKQEAHQLRLVLSAPADSESDNDGRSS